jgi:hypothetical protein
MAFDDQTGTGPGICSLHCVCRFQSRIFSCRISYTGYSRLLESLEMGTDCASLQALTGARTSTSTRCMAAQFRRVQEAGIFLLYVSIHCTVHPILWLHVSPHFSTSRTMHLNLLLRVMSESISPLASPHPALL